MPLVVAALIVCLFLRKWLVVSCRRDAISRTFIQAIEALENANLVRPARP